MRFLMEGNQKFKEEFYLYCLNLRTFQVTSIVDFVVKVHRAQ